MITLCHAAKGGSGTTLVAAIGAIDSPGPVLLVDFEGDAPAMVGIAEPDRPGILDWLASDAPAEHLDDLLIEITPDCTLLAATSSGFTTPAPIPDPSIRGDRWTELHEWFADWAHHSGGSVTIDAGTIHLPAAFVEPCDQRWLVTRACYLSLRRAARLPVRPTGIVLIEEPGRSLSRRDVETAVGAPIVATLPWEPRIARSVDAGLLLAGRLPRAMHRALAHVAA